MGLLRIFILPCDEYRHEGLIKLTLPIETMRLTLLAEWLPTVPWLIT